MGYPNRGSGPCRRNRVDIPTLLKVLGQTFGGRSRAWRILYFDPMVLEVLRADVLRETSRSFTFTAPVFADRGLHRLFDDAFRYRVGQGGIMPCETAVLRLVARLGVHSTTRPVRDEGPTACIRRALEMIDADPAAPLILIDLAKEAGLSRYQLIRAFARELGLTPHAYILQRRIALAQRLIRAGRDLAAVATEAGFCDQSHLTRWFVRQFGLTPRRYAVRFRSAVTFARSRTFVQDERRRGTHSHRMLTLRRCEEEDLATMLAIINAAAEAYRDVIPADRWREPYMPEAELRREIAAGVEFWGLESEDGSIGVMGMQPVRDVDVIRHAYVRPDRQGHGVGAELIGYLRRRSTRRMLVGTWAAASWAISFYERHGFALVAQEHAAALLRTYWTIPERQVETSVVLANPPL